MANKKTNNNKKSNKSKNTTNNKSKAKNTKVVSSKAGNATKKTNVKVEKINPTTYEKDVINNDKRNIFIMKSLIFFGVVMFCLALVYLMYHFFVEESDIKINMSTDKLMEYVTIDGNEELIMTQKFVSDLEYSMRYDISEFKVFKYKKQDIYKSLNDERILVAVERAIIPSNCTEISNNNEYNNCYIKSDDYTEYYYVGTTEQSYKITIKTPGSSDYEEDTKIRIEHMLESFQITN